MKFIFYIAFLSSLNSFCQVDCAKVNMDYSGFCFEYYPNGKVKWVKEFSGREAVGVWMGFDEHGNFSKQINCKEKADSLIKIYCNDCLIEDDLWEIIPSNENYAIDEDFWIEPEPIYPGGLDSLKSFINKNFKFPQIAIDSGITGKIYVSFVVEVDSKMSNIAIIKGINDCPECNEEALRIFRLMPNWIPPKENGKNIRTRMTIPINLKLD